MMLLNAPDDLLDEADDLEQLMRHWSCSEATCFRERCCSKSHANKLYLTECQFQDGEADIKTKVNVEEVTREMRQQALHLLRCLLSFHNAVEELPAALTLFDAYCVYSPQKVADSLENPSSLAAIVAAIARITLKSGAIACSEEQLRPTLDLVNEVHIIKALNGRIRLTSVVEWSSAVIGRLYALSYEDPQLMVAVQQALPYVLYWAQLFLSRIASSALIPPKVQALGACSVGLINASLMEVQEVIPPELPQTTWQELLLIQWAGAAGQPGPGQVLVTADSLSRAACVDVDELRHNVFQLASKIQEIM